MEKKKKSGVAMINTCKNDTRQHYVPGAKLTYTTRIKQMLKQELGYQGKPKIIELLAEEIAIITKECYENDIGVGQIKAIVPSIEDKPNWAQTIEDTKLVTVTLTLMAEEDIEEVPFHLTPLRRSLYPASLLQYPFPSSQFYYVRPLLLISQLCLFL